MNLRNVIESHLYSERLARKQFAEQIGWGPNVLTRFLNGKDVSAQNLSALMVWLLSEKEEIDG